MKKKKIKSVGFIVQEEMNSPANPTNPINHSNFVPLRDLDYTPIVVRPQNATSRRGHAMINVLSDDEIAKMDERNAEVDEMTIEYIMNLIDEPDDVASETIGLDAETVTLILNEFESVLANFGFYIHRPTIVQCEDGERIVRSSCDDEPVDAFTHEPVAPSLVLGR